MDFWQSSKNSGSGESSFREPDRSMSRLGGGIPVIVIDVLGKYPVVGAMALSPRRPARGPHSQPEPTGSAGLAVRRDCSILQADAVRSQ